MFAASRLLLERNFCRRAMPFDNVPFDMWRVIDRPIRFNEFPVPRPVRDADVYIGLPKMKVHVHTTFTGCLKLQFWKSA